MRAEEKRSIRRNGECFIIYNLNKLIKEGDSFWRTTRPSPGRKFTTVQTDLNREVLFLAWHPPQANDAAQ